MCNKVSVKEEPGYYAGEMGVTYTGPIQPKLFVANAYDHPLIPVITKEATGLLQYYRWGLIPPWVTNGSQALDIMNSTINARSEEMWHKPSFKKAAVNQQCLVIVDGFFEYRHVMGDKIPYYICRKDYKPMAIAGLYNIWQGQGTFTMCMMDAGETLIGRIHNSVKRMPVILAPESATDWISGGDMDFDSFTEVVNAVHDEELQAWTVSKDLGRAKAQPNRPEILNEFTYPGLPEL